MHAGAGRWKEPVCGKNDLSERAVINSPVGTRVEFLVKHSRKRVWVGECSRRDRTKVKE